eukprot:CCRYP_018388-RA/>CCRYP_018388-RA protein AED:0.83 eAED:0.39 QI:0/0/0/0.5/1/1/2/0/220
MSASIYKAPDVASLVKIIETEGINTIPGRPDCRKLVHLINKLASGCRNIDCEYSSNGMSWLVFPQDLYVSLIPENIVAPLQPPIVPPYNPNGTQQENAALYQHLTTKYGHPSPHDITKNDERMHAPWDATETCPSLSNIYATVPLIHDNQKTMRSTVIEHDFCLPIDDSAEFKLFIGATIADQCEGTVYTDQTENFPVTSYHGKRCQFFAYEYCSNAILV